MAKKFNSFSSLDEKNETILNKYIEVFSSDLAQVPNRFSYDTEKYQSFLLGTKKFETLKNGAADCQSIATIGRARSGFSVMITTYSGDTDSKLFSYSMSIYPSSVKNIEDIENYTRFKMLKKFVKNREDVLENIYEGLRLFSFPRRYGRSAVIYSSRITNVNYINASRIAISFPVNPTSKSPPVLIDGEIKSHLSKQDLAEIKTIFDRDDRIKANCKVKVNGNFQKLLGGF